MRPYKTMMDGDAWICFGPDFTDLQDSDDYAYGHTELEAINCYLLILEVRNTALDSY